MKLTLVVYRRLYTMCLLGVTILFGFQIYSGHWLQTDLRALLPQEQHWSDIQLKADQQQEQLFNQQILALVGSIDPQTAFMLAEHISEQWQQSGLFQQVYAKTQPNLTALQQQINQLKLATLPVSIQKQLLEQPQHYFQQYAEQIVNPFQANLLPLTQDWLGFGRFVLAQAQQQSQIQWHSDNGMLFVQHEGKTWVLLRAELAQGDLINPQQNLTALLADNAQWIAQHQAEWLATGAALFATATKQQAEKESTLMGAVGISFTLLLLLIVFRTLRVLWLLLPIGVGMLCGVVATVCFFGQVHILTLVVGTSLIGVLIDFPLHWLASSLFKQQWQAEREMLSLRFTFLISLFVTLLGYGLLGFTALPVLQQTALFSAFALVCAIIATLLYLPLFFQHHQPRQWTITDKRFSVHLPKPIKWLCLLFGTVGLISGLYKSQWQDDIRQWVAMPPELLRQAQQISLITGIDLSNQYFLLTAENDDQLLNKSKQLTEKLVDLQQQGKLVAIQSLSQWLMSKQEQMVFVEKLNQQIQPTDYAILQQIGVPMAQVNEALKQLKNQPHLSLSQALNYELAQSWRTLYLGELQTGKVVGIVKVAGVKDKSALIALANQQDIYWQDKPEHLNQAFQDTRDQAAWLKLFSFLLAGLLLWRLFGLKRSVQMLLIPLLAIASTVAIFGWLGLPISLFAMFGLLLVSAISIDYIAYIYTVSERLLAKQITISLAAMTTLISFTLLGLSSTPAVASFGWSVSLGVVISLLIIFKTLR
ncbi:MMPL family transporter [Pasteurella oralis]|uniref:MMPL family transporter n=1 Tax=Pasteurella oralis TaxID=1071947 RepID=UPI000C79DBC2|nr:hypothetical protein [Pasteurella oralis]